MAPTTVQVLGHGSRPGALSVVETASAAATAVLFPGDISAPRAALLSDSSLARFEPYCVEQLAASLANRFPSCTTVVVHPPRNVDGFSCYDGYLERLTETGDPADGLYESGGSCCEHVLALIRSAEQQCPGVSARPLHLLGFSKGAVVLNQLLAEIGASAASPAAEALLAATASWAWLDPGLNLPGPIFLEEPAALRRAARRLCARAPAAPTLSVALTPYQLEKDDDEAEEAGWRSLYVAVARRWLPAGWLPAEWSESAAVRGLRRFERAMAKEGVVLARERCVLDQPASLEGHFAVLDTFSAPWECGTTER
jgi:hypothetical protein